MFRSLALALSAVLELGLQYSPEGEPIDALVRQLGSSDHKQRDKATRTLLARPDAEGLLRDAANSKDLEISRRAASILEQFELRRSRLPEIDEAIRFGRVETAIQLMAESPTGKHEHLFWDRFQYLCADLCDRHNKGTGRNGGNITREPCPLMGHTKVDRFSESVRHPRAIDRFFLLRTCTVDYDTNRLGTGITQSISGLNAVVAGPASIGKVTVFNTAILAKGSVEMHRVSLDRVLILSGGDITFRNVYAVVNCLIIARGTVDAPYTGFGHSRVIAGGSVRYFKESTALSVITDHEPNPLGYVQWEKAQAGENKAPRSDGQKK